MQEILDYVTLFIGAVSLIMALVLMVSILNRSTRRFLSNPFMTGVLFSVSVFLTMSDPIDLGAGGIHDLRSLLIGTATALLGPLVGAMTLATGLLMRWTIGGTGMVPGMVAMVLTFSGAMVWRHFIKTSRISFGKRSALLGCFISIHLLAFFLFPVEVWRSLLPMLAPYYIAANVLGAMLISYLIGGELSFLSEAEAARNYANTDHLTGLLNRRGFEMVYTPAGVPIDQNKGRALLYFDIDNFKSINDTYGHAVGDDVLREVTNRISTNLRPNDIFARLGGDEFVVILNQIDTKEAKHIAERCRKVIAEGGLTVGQRSLDVSISIGAIWMLEHTEIEQILDQADKALYTAKAKGRNKVVFKQSNASPVGSAPVLA